MRVEVTNHAATRYAERIAERDNKTDINIYVQQNGDKIADDINKMLEYSTFIYSGKIGNKEKNVVNVYLSGEWVLLLDTPQSKVITLYKIDFGIGDDFNKIFIDRVLERLEQHKVILEEKENEIAEQRSVYLQIIKDNEEQIAEFKASIKKLEKLNEDYRSVIDNINAECASARLAIRNDVETLTRSYY